MRSRFHRSVLVSAVMAGMLLLHNSAFAESSQAKAANEEQIARGRYLVTTSGCHDCHSPKTMGPNGPIPHPMKLLSGHQADSELPEVPEGVIGPDKWGALANQDLTAWVGMWGTSFASNLTPDKATGIGAWTDEKFIEALRKGKHLGTGRDLLPPMPWQMIGQMTDEDLKAIFAYLQSIKPIRNVVPQPIPPGGKGH